MKNLNNSGLKEISFHESITIDGGSDIGYALGYATGVLSRFVEAVADSFNSTLERGMENIDNVHG